MGQCMTAPAANVSNPDKTPPNVVKKKNSVVRKAGGFMTLNIPLIVTNNVGLVQRANAAACQLFQYETMDGLPIEKLLPKSIAAKHKRFMERYLQTGKSSIIGTTGREMNAVRSDGTSIPILLTISQIPNGFIAGLLDRKDVMRSAEERLQLESANRTIAERTRFISYLSHEIRVPMNAMCIGI